MKHLAAALVVLALLAGSFAGDLGWIPEAAANGWDVCAGAGLVVFAVLLFWGAKR